MVDKKAQMKIQQMAFMIVAVVVFFAMVAIIYFSLSLRGLDAKVQELRDDEARALAKQLSSSPEFSFTASSDCEACIDVNKAFFIAQNEAYKERFWNLDYLSIERIYPNSTTSGVKCERLDQYISHQCDQISVLEDNTYATKTAFVSLAVWDPVLGAYRYELGKIYVSAPELDK